MIDRALPTPAGFPVHRHVHTRWDDHDTYDHVNNALYYSFVDSAIGDWLLDATQHDVRVQEAIGVVVESSCRFHREIRFPEVVTVGLRSGGVGNSSVRYEFALFVGDEIAGAGTFSHVYVDRHTRRPVSVPDPIRTAVVDQLTVDRTESVADDHQPRVFASIEELAQAKGEVIGISGWHTIDQRRVDQFAAATEDEQWIHVDPDRAATGPFGSTVAHGFLSLSLVSTLLWESYDVQGVAVTINYGTDKVRFPAPLHVGKKVRGTVELLDVDPGPKGGKVRTRVTVEAEDSERPVCVAETTVLLVPEP